MANRYLLIVTRQEFNRRWDKVTLLTALVVAFCRRMVYSRSLIKRIADRIWKHVIPLSGFVLLALLQCQTAWSQLVQWPVAEGGNGHFYEVVSAAAGISWGNASLAATDRGGYLATITSADENAFVFNLADQNAAVWYSGYGPWLGGIQPAGSGEPAGGWSWVTGEAFSYQNWTPGQPNNNQNEDRIQFGGQANRSSTWNDIGQNNTNFTRGFAIEYDRHPNAITLFIVRKDADEVELSWA